MIIFQKGYPASVESQAVAGTTLRIISQAVSCSISHHRQAGNGVIAHRQENYSWESVSPKDGLIAVPCRQLQFGRQCAASRSHAADLSCLQG
jgi:hypothetical protein